MAISTINSHVVSHIKMRDGTEYDVKVSYYDDSGKPVEFNPGSTSLSFFGEKPETKREFDDLVKTLAETHAAKANQSLKSLKIIHLNNAGVKFSDTDTIKPHAIDLTPDQTAFLLNNYNQNYTKVNEVWNKTAQILIQNYHHYQTARNEATVEIPATFKQAPRPVTSVGLDLTQTSKPDAPTHPNHLDRDDDDSEPPSPVAPQDHTHMKTQCDGLDLRFDGEQKAVQDRFIHEDGRIEPEPPLLQEMGVPSFDGIRDSIRNMWSSWRAPAKTHSLVDLGVLSSSVDLNHLTTPRANLVKAYLQESTTGFFKKPSKLTIASTIDLKEFTNAIYDCTNSISFGAMLDAMNVQYEALIAEMDVVATRFPTQASEIDRLKLTIAIEFKRKLFDLLKRYYKEHEAKQKEIDEAWKLFQNPARNKIPGNPFTPTSLVTAKKELGIKP